MEAKEIERRWLVNKEIYDEPSGSFQEFLETAFIPSELSYGPVCRFRWKHTADGEDKYYLTVKSDGGLVRDELEYRITKEQYINLTKDLYKKKVRYDKTPSSTSKKVLEIKDMGDYYIAEIEFDSAEEANDYKLCASEFSNLFKEEPLDVTEDRNFNFYTKYMEEAETYYVNALMDSIK